jgi:hypothetical protein
MRVFSLLFVAAYALLVSTPTLADIASGTPLFRWIPPTSDVGDPTAVPPVPPKPLPVTGPGSLESYRILCGDGVNPKVEVKMVLHPTLTWQSPAGKFGGGNHSCSVTAKLVGGGYSLESNTVNFVIVSLPQPPTNLTVQ